MIKKILTLFACLFVASCVSKKVDYSNTSLQIIHPLTVYPKSSSAIMQEGKNIISARRNRYKPYCALESNRLAERHPFQIAPDTLTVKTIYSDYNYFGSVRYEGIRKYRRYLDDEYGPYDVRTVIEFESNNQDIRQLNCIRWSSDGYDFHLTLEDINEILGSRATVINANNP